MKKLTLVILVLALMLSVTACAPGIKATAQNEYDVFPNTDWSMTKDEVITALKLDVKDYDEKLILSRIDGDYGFTIKQKQFGQDATVEFLFVDNYPEPAIDTGLYMVVVRTDDTKADMEAITAEFDTQLEKMDKIHGYDTSIREKKVITGENVGNSYISKLSPDTLEDAQIKEKTITALKSMSHGMKYDNQPLTEIRLIQNAQTNEIIVLYNGLFAAVSNKV